MKQLLFPFFLFILFSCGNEPKKAEIGSDNQSQQPSLPIREFIKKFKIVQAPFHYQDAQMERLQRQLFELKKNSIDTLFCKLPDDAPVYGYAMLADTSTFYSLIFFHSADILYPVLSTYSKTGKLLSEESLAVRGCGSDCGLRYCSSTANIEKNLSIYIADTSYYEGMCDSAGNYTTGDSTFIYSKTGSIDKSGIIKMSEERELRTGGKK